MPAADAPSELVALGLRPGDRVRWRRGESEHWKEAKVERVERDGSLGVRDTKGAARAIPIERVEVRRKGRRGGVVWEPVIRVASQTEQLDLL